MWEKIYAYLTFTRKERLGILVLLAVIMILFVVPYFVQPPIGSRDEKAYQKYGEGIRKFRSAEAAEPRYGAQSGSPGDSIHYGPRENIVSGEMENKPTPFYFDPNRISGADWHRLGLQDKLVFTIMHYIQRGGRFRSASDLRKLYGLKSEDYERLFPYVRIAEQPAAIREQRIKVQPHGQKSGAQWKQQNTGAEHASNYFSYAFDRKKPEDLDINQADSSVWRQLPGIGIKLASRIIHFREKLGGFYDVDQLRETFGLADSTFENIRPFLHIRSANLKKIDLNSAAQESLQAHPYIRWRLAKGIIQYREQHGGFKSVGELQQLAQMDSGKFQKLEPYLEVK
ncbi:MAG: helix-hairpin-helix domain-containing protein [Bacteroidota bacterium]|nr:helix-hairpin-helix domain-containing protein [Bacteroidota bacterium]